MEQTAVEKAKELFDKFYIKVHDRDGTSAMNGFEAKQCALILVDEILKINSVDKDYDLSNYWTEVKQEINKL